MTPDMMFCTQTFKRIDGLVAMGEREDYTLLACKLATDGARSPEFRDKLSVYI